MQHAESSSRPNDDHTCKVLLTPAAAARSGTLSRKELKDILAVFEEMLAVGARLDFSNNVEVCRHLDKNAFIDQ